MKKVLSLLLTLAMLLSLFPAAAAAEAPQEPQGTLVYVSAAGDDQNTGADEAHPVATLERGYELALALEDGIKTNAAASATIAVLDALSPITGDLDAWADYRHAGRLTITGQGPDAAIVFDGAADRRFQFGGPTAVDALTLANGSKNLRLYAGTDLTLGKGVKCVGKVRLDGGLSSGTVENTTMHVACDTLTIVHGSEGSVTGKVTIEVDGTNITSQISAGLNNSGAATAPAESELTLRGGAVAKLAFATGHKAPARSVINLYDCTVTELRSGRGAKMEALPELELNFYESPASLKKYGATYGTISDLALHFSGVTGSFPWANLPTANSILVDGNSDFTVTTAFPAIAKESFTVETGSTVTLDKDANPTLPQWTGGGLVKLTGDAGPVDPPVDPQGLSHVYVSAAGDDQNTGADEAHPVATLARGYELVLALEGGIQTDAAAAATITVLDALGPIAGDLDAWTNYRHAGRLTITGQGDCAAIVFDGTANRRFQFGGPTAVDGLTIDNGTGVLRLYAGTDLTLGSGVKCSAKVRLDGGVIPGTGTVEDTAMHIACDTLTHVFGSEGTVTGKVTIEVDGTNIVNQISAGLNAKGKTAPREGELTLRGGATVGQYLFLNSHGTVGEERMVINLYDCSVKAARSGRGAKDSPDLKRLELNIHDAGAIFGEYGATYGSILDVAIRLSGVSGEIKWNLPTANVSSILVDGTSDFTVASVFPAVAEGVLTVETGSTVTLDRDTNDRLPPYTGGGVVKLSGGDVPPQRDPLPAVYVASTGDDTAAGTDAEHPVRTLDRAYELTAQSATGSDPTAATAIVVMDTLELTDSFYAERNYPHKGTVTLTSNYGGVDYKAQGARLRLNYAGSKSIALGGPTVFSHLKVSRLNPAGASYVTTNIYTGPDFHMAEDVELVGGEGAGEVPGNKDYRFQLRAGNYYDPAGDVKVHMSSGTCYFLMAASNRQGTNGDVTITADGTARPWYITGGGESGGAIGGTVTINMADDALADRIYVSSTYTAGHEKKLTVNLAGGTVTSLAGGRAAGTWLEELELNISGAGKAPNAMSLTNTKGNGTVERFTLRMLGVEATLSPDWSLINKLVADRGANIAVSSVLGDTALEVAPGSTVFLSYPNTVLPAWTGVGGASEKGTVTLEDTDTVLGELLLSADFEDGTAADQSGNGRDGTVHGGVSYVTGVDGGKAAYFKNPTPGAAEQYIDFGVLPVGTKDFTVSFWIKSDRGGWAGVPANGGTAYDMTALHPQAQARVLLSNKDFSTPDKQGFALLTAGYYLYSGSSLYTGVSAAPYQIDGVKEPLDDRWHQVTVTFDRDGMEHILVDGLLAASSYIRSQGAGSLDAATAAEHLILGADGLGQYGLDLTAIDRLEIYEGVMSMREARARWYCTQTVRLTLELEERGVRAGSQYTQAAIDAIRARARTAGEQARALQAAGVPELEQAQALYEDFRGAYEDFLMGQAPLVSFLQISDAHIESVDSPRYQTLVRALNWANELGIDAYLDSGDYTSNGAVAEYEAYWSAYKSAYGSLKTFLALGNHEVRVLSGDEVAAQHIPGLVSVGAVSEGYDKFYYEGEVNGYHVLVLSDYLRTYPNYDGAQGMEAEQLQWAEEKLNAYCGQGKPVFVLIHPCVAEALGMESDATPTTIQPPALYDLFDAHPEVIVSTGHIHHGLGDICGVFEMRSGYHVLDVPAFRHNNIGYGSKSTETSGAHHTGYFVYVYEDKVQYRAVDFATGEWLTAYDQAISLTEEPLELGGSVAITGEARVGQTLTADLSGMLPADAAVTLTWSRGGTVVLGHESSYTITEEDVGSVITLTVEGTGDYCGTLTAQSEAVAGQETGGYVPPYPTDPTAPDEPTEPGEDKPDQPEPSVGGFVDIEDNWALEGIRYVVENGLMDGVDATHFAPGEEMTRGMAVTVLYRLAGEPEVIGKADWVDVESGAWFTDAITWATRRGIVNGVDAQRFAPDDVMTREQMAALFFRYYQAMDLKPSGSADLSGYADLDQISAYALTAFRWAVEEGIINGTSATTLSPRETVTREQLAALLARISR